NPVPSPGLDVDVLGNTLGLVGTIQLGRYGPYLGGSFAVTALAKSVTAANLEFPLERAGLGDLVAQPPALGWRLPHVDVVTSDSLFIPTGRFLFGRRGNLSAGQFTHLFSAGGAVYFDRGHTVFLSALASYELNQRKIDLDVTRGDAVQIQG